MEKCTLNTDHLTLEKGKPYIFFLYFYTVFLLYFYNLKNTVKTSIYLNHVGV